VALVKDCVDTTRIALMPGPGWPQQTGVMEPTQVLPMTGGFVELGGDSCVVYSRTGTRLNSIQSGYGRPALAAGKTRFVLYNRSGNELRVESRTQNLYTKKLENKIFLCAMSDNGTLAVVTDDVSSMAELLVYSPTMEQQLRWNMTSNDGTPLRMAFSPDSRRLAAAAVTASGGQMQTNLYVVTLAQGDPVNVGSQSGVPQWVGWLSGTTLLAVYDSRAILYNAAGGERARYEFGGGTLRDVSVDSAGNVALLLASGQVCQLVTLDKELNVQYSGNVTTSNKVVRRGACLSAHRQYRGEPDFCGGVPVEPEPDGPAAGAAGGCQADTGLLRQHGAAGNGTGNLSGKLRKRRESFLKLALCGRK
jgi:hypothetical protein